MNSLKIGEERKRWNTVSTKRPHEDLLHETGKDVPRRPPGVRTASSGEKIKDTVTFPPGHLYAPTGQGSRVRPPRHLPDLTCPLSASSMLGKVCTRSCTRIRLWAPMSFYYLLQIMRLICSSYLVRNISLRRLHQDASKTMIDTTLLSHNQISSAPQILPLLNSFL